MFGTQAEITDKMITEFSKTVEMFDFTPAEAHLFSYLYLKKEPMTLDEMSEAIGKSKTSMSTSIRSLAEANLVTRVWKKGVRKDLYKANTQLFKIFMNTYMNKWIEATNYQKIALEEMNEQVKQLPEAIASGPAEDLKNIIVFHDQVKTVFKDMKPD
jgi:DNA-binding transcriptional regulator GbsR (MarR family)